jgi:hypothetical protein
MTLTQFTMLCVELSIDPSMAVTDQHTIDYIKNNKPTTEQMREYLINNY